MGKLTDLSNKIERSYNNILKIVLDKSNALEIENIELRRELLRLEKINKELIRYIGSKILSKEPSHNSEEVKG